MYASKKGLLENSKLLIFTDLDGTLLDSRYSYSAALPALGLIRERNIPLIVCSSKTKAEIEIFRKKIGNTHPFISENGGGIFIPGKYFENPVRASGNNVKGEKDYVIIKLGAPYKELRKALEELRSRGFNVKGFGEMSAREVSKLTGLTISGAKLAKQRDFDEPFIFNGSDKAAKKMKQSIKARKLNYTQGEFYHLMGDSDKGRAVRILMDLYEREYGSIISIALGDSPNDIEMLREADYPVVVKKKDGSYDRRVRVNKLIRAEGIGPSGWNSAITNLLRNFFDHKDSV